MRKALKTIDSRVMVDVKKSGLTVTQFGVLEVLYSKGSMKIGELIEKVLSSSGNMTVVIRNMEKNGWITKKVDKNDKRAFIIELTKSGTKLIKEVLPKHTESITDVFQVLTTEDKVGLMEILKKFKNLEGEKSE